MTMTVSQSSIFNLQRYLDGFIRLVNRRRRFGHLASLGRERHEGAF